MPASPSGAAWLLDVLHELVHAHSGADVACMFLPVDAPAEVEDTVEVACPAMTPEIRGELTLALADQGLRATEQREPARLLLPTVAGHEHVAVVPVVFGRRSAGVLVTAAAGAPLGRAGLARVTELAGRGLGWVNAAGDTARALADAHEEQRRVTGELDETRMFLELQERLVDARTTTAVVAALSDWLAAPVVVQLPNTIVVEARGANARELGLAPERSAAEHEVFNRAAAGGTRVLPATKKLPARVVTPICGGDGTAVGYLLAGVGERGKDVTRRALSVSQRLIAYQMSVRQEIEASVATLRQRLLSDVLENRPVDNLGTRAAKLGHDLSVEHIPLAVGLRGPAGDALRDRLTRLVDHHCVQASTAAVTPLIGTTEDVVMALVPAPLPAGAGALGRAIQADAAEAGLDVVVGIGPAATGPLPLSAAAARARWAQQVLHDPAVGAGTAVAHIDDLGIYALLFDHQRAGELHAFAIRWLGPLLDYDREHRSELVPTLRALFAQRSLTDAAAALHIHISTLKYRVGRIEAILGRSVEDWDNIFHLELAMRVLSVFP
jgi:sugar diacid utilization regulator